MPYKKMGFGQHTFAKKVRLELIVSVMNPGEGETSVPVAVVHSATKKADWDKQIKVPGVGAELYMELDSKNNTLCLKLKADT